MMTIKTLLARLANLLKLDDESFFEAERRREEKFLSGAADIYELEARQRAWNRRTQSAFPA